MTRLTYGVAPGDIIAQIFTDPTTTDPAHRDFGPLQGSLQIWTFDRTAQETDLLDISDVPIPSGLVSADSRARTQFKGKDGYTQAYWGLSSDGQWWLFNPSDIASRQANDWTNLANKPAVIAAGADAAAARTAIGAGVSTLMTSAEGIAGTDTNPRQITASTLRAIIMSLLASFANLHVQPVWDGTGTAPTRTTGLPATSLEMWRQPFAPAADSTHAKVGDMWELTA